MTKYNIVEMGYFLKNKNKKIKYEEANLLNYKRISKIDFSGKIHLKNNVPSKTDMIEVENGDLIISGINVAKGAIAVLENHDKALATIHYSSYEYNKDLVDIDYLKYFFKSDTFGEILKQSIKGGIKTEIKPKRFLKLKIPLPPLCIQKEIAQKAKLLDKNIEILEQKNKQMILFCNMYFKNISKLLLLQFHNYQEYYLKDIISFGPKNGFSPQAVNYKTNVKNLTLSATTSGFFIHGLYKYVDCAIPDDSYLWVKNGDILIQRGNSIEYVGISAIYKGADNQYIYPDLMIKIRANENIVLSEYLQIFLNSLDVRNYFKENASGTSGSMPKINHKILLNTKILVPNIEEQHKYINCYNYISKYIKVINDKLENNNKLINLLNKAIQQEIIN